MPSGVHIKSQLNVRLSDEAHAALAYLAAEDGLSQAAVIEILLREAVKKRGQRLRDVVEQYG